MSFNKIKMTRLLLLFLFLSFPASSVWAHAFPMRSEPKVGSEVKEAPRSVKIWFDGDLEPAFSGMHVFGSDGKEVDANDARVDDTDHTLLIVTVPKAPPGKYQVKWEVVSTDTHRTEGEFTFNIK